MKQGRTCVLNKSSFLFKAAKRSADEFVINFNEDNDHQDGEQNFLYLDQE